MAKEEARNTVIFDIAGASTDKYIIQDAAVSFTISTTAPEGFVTVLVEGAYKTFKYIVGPSVVGMVQDLVTNSTLDDLAVIGKLCKISFTPGGTHPKVGGGTTALPAATEGLVIMQWIRRGL